MATTANRTATRLPDGRTLNQLYYGPGHLHQINLDGQVVSDFERDALHREVSRTQGQLSSAFAYDPAGRMVAQRVTRGGVGGPDLSGLAPTSDMSANMSGLIERRYAYDAAGQLRQWLDRDRGLTRYGYDAIGRIVQSQIGLHPPATASGASANAAVRAGTPVNSSVARRIPVTTEQFHWDAASNPVPAPSPGLAVVPVPGNRLTVWQDERYRYDVHGNLIERLQGKRGSAAQTLTVLRWDAAHQLTQATVQRGALESGGITTQTYRYAYDALGRRVAKVDAFGATAFAWDGDRMALEARGGNETLHLYEPGGFVPLAQVHNGQLHHLHTDHLGTPLEASNDAGDITWRISYRTWGSVVLEEAVEIQQKLRFQGQYFDAETGLHYNRFRYYDPGPGRFVSQDPIGLAGGTNLFGYGANPVGWVDPWGLAPCPCADPCGLASHGDQPSPRPGNAQSHHQVQDAWAQANVPGYNRNDAPSILLDRPSHSTITTAQNARRSSRLAAGEPKWGTSIQDEFDNAYRDLTSAGVSEKCKRKAIKKSYKYFDSIGGFK